LIFRVRLNCQHRDVPLGRDDFQIRLRHRFVAFASPRSAVRDKALTSEHNSSITGFTDNPPGREDSLQVGATERTGTRQLKYVRPSRRIIIRSSTARPKRVHYITASRTRRDLFVFSVVTHENGQLMAKLPPM